MIQIAMLGTGTMGAAMARRIRARGMPVTAWNRSRQRAEPLAADGITIADTPRAAAAGAHVIITMLADGPAVEAAITGPDGAAQGASPGAIWVQTSTVGVVACRRLADLARQHRLAFVDAPVLGTKEPAERGELTVLASGEPELEARVRPVLDPVARRIIWLGPAGRGTRAKLAVNGLIMGLTGVLAENIALCQALGLDPRVFLDAIKGGPADAPYVQLKGQAMVEHRFAPSFALRLAHKDLRLILEAAEETGADLPVTAALERLFARAVTDGHGDEDLAAVVNAVEPAPRR